MIQQFYFQVYIQRKLKPKFEKIHAALSAIAKTWSLGQPYSAMSWRTVWRKRKVKQTHPWEKQ